MNSLQQRHRAAAVRFLHERRFMAFEDIYDEAVASGVKPEKP